MNADPAELRVYSGKSMNPTLCELDLMEIQPYQGRPIRVGDVILFHSPGRSLPVAHRVEHIALDGIRTRGDNCHPPDDLLLDSDQVIGQVIAAHRGMRRRRVPNGNLGRFWAWLLRLTLPIGGAVNRILHIPYHSLSGIGGISRWLPAVWRPRKVLFQAGEKRIWRILWGRHVIAQYEEGRGEWRIRRPFRLFINPHDVDMEQ